jgi:DNA-binding transcriptional LysR family regulator
VDDWERLEARKLYEEHFGLLLSRQHRLSQRNGIEPSDLFDERLLSRPNCWFADTLSAKMREAGAKSVTRHEVPFLDDLSGLVRAKFGVGVWPASRQPSNDLFIKPVRGAGMNRWIHVYTVAGRRHSVATATLISLLRARDWPQSPPAERAIAEALH